MMQWKLRIRNWMTSKFSFVTCFVRVRQVITIPMLSVLRSNHNRFSIQSMLRKLPISGRSKKNSTGSDDEVSDSSQQSSYCSLSSSQSSSQSSQSSDEDDRSSRLLCKVCLDQRLEVVFIPCGHFICCTTCSRSLSHCPYCRKHIASALKTYLS